MPLTRVEFPSLCPSKMKMKKKQFQPQTELSDNGRRDGPFVHARRRPAAVGNCERRHSGNRNGATSGTNEEQQQPSLCGAHQCAACPKHTAADDGAKPPAGLELVVVAKA